MNITGVHCHSNKSPRDRLPQAFFAAYLVLWILTAIKPYNRQDWLLENLLVFATVPVLLATFRRFRFSNLSYGLVTACLILHAFGAHHTYSEMPVGNWLRDDWQFSRNHYDRVVHFLFGLLISYPLCELLGLIARLQRGCEPRKAAQRTGRLPSNWFVHSARKAE